MAMALHRLLSSRSRPGPGCSKPRFPHCKKDAEMELYLVFKVLWWLLLGVLLMGLGIMVGMDMGVGALLRYVGRNDTERRIALNIIAPHWDGNQVWFVLGGGAIFAAFPLIYATAFSGLYIVM